MLSILRTRNLFRFLKTEVAIWRKENPDPDSPFVCVCFFKYYSFAPVTYKVGLNIHFREGHFGRVSFPVLRGGRSKLCRSLWLVVAKGRKEWAKLLSSHSLCQRYTSCSQRASPSNFAHFVSELSPGLFSLRLHFEEGHLKCVERKRGKQR